MWPQPRLHSIDRRHHFLYPEKQDNFVRFYAMQSIILGGAWFLSAFVYAVVACGFGLHSGNWSILRYYFLGWPCGVGYHRDSCCFHRYAVVKRSAGSAGKSPTSVRLRASRWKVAANNPVIPSLIEESRRESFGVTARDPSSSLRMTAAEAA